MSSTSLTRRLALAAAALLMAGAVQAQTGPVPLTPFERAMTEYERQHFAEAYQALWVLADQGHAEAARIALLMATHGPRLYGMRFAIGPVQQERWLAAALPYADGSALALARRNPR